MTRQKAIDDLVEALVLETGEDIRVVGQMCVDEIPRWKLAAFFEERAKYYEHDEGDKERAEEMRRLASIARRGG